jgi:hypothetical protein
MAIDGGMISDKKEFLHLWNNGVLGNKLRSWDTYEELQRSGYRGSVGIRGRAVDSKLVRYYVPYEDILETVARITADPTSVYFGESAPDSQLILQGEFFHGENRSGTFIDRHLTYSRFKGPMRKALSLPLYPYPEATLEGNLYEAWKFDLSGLQAIMLLKSTMNENSYDDFVALQELYPDHTIEFGVYSSCLGSCDGRNTLIWEVRYY